MSSEQPAIVIAKREETTRWDKFGKLLTAILAVAVIGGMVATGYVFGMHRGGAITTKKMERTIAERTTVTHAYAQVATYLLLRPGMTTKIDTIYVCASPNNAIAFIDEPTCGIGQTKISFLVTYRASGEPILGTPNFNGTPNFDSSPAAVQVADAK